MTSRWSFHRRASARWRVSATAISGSPVGRRFSIRVTAEQVGRISGRTCPEAGNLRGEVPRSAYGLDHGGGRTRRQPPGSSAPGAPDRGRRQDVDPARGACGCRRRRRRTGFPGYRARYRRRAGSPPSRAAAFQVRPVICDTGRRRYLGGDGAPRSRSTRSGTSCCFPGSRGQLYSPGKFDAERELSDLPILNHGPVRNGLGMRRSRWARSASGATRGGCSRPFLASPLVAGALRGRFDIDDLLRPSLVGN